MTTDEAIANIMPLAKDRAREMIDRLSSDIIFEGITLVDFFALMWLQGIRDAVRVEKREEKR